MNIINHNSLDEFYQYSSKQHQYKPTRMDAIKYGDMAMDEIKPTINELKAMRSVWYDC